MEMCAVREMRTEQALNGMLDPGGDPAGSFRPYPDAMTVVDGLIAVFVNDPVCPHCGQAPVKPMPYMAHMLRISYKRRMLQLDVREELAYEEGKLYQMRWRSGS